MYMQRITVPRKLLLCIEFYKPCIDTIDNDRARLSGVYIVCKTISFDIYICIMDIVYRCSRAFMAL